METTLVAPWVPEITRRPVAFAQVREDAILDQEVVEKLDNGAQVLMVASGGCTAAALASVPKISRLHLVDPNASQIALSRLKLRLLASAGPTERLSILGHAPMPVAERRLCLTSELQALELPVDAMGPIDLLAKVGPDRVARYSALLCQFQD